MSSLHELLNLSETVLAVIRTDGNGRIVDSMGDPRRVAGIRLDLLTASVASFGASIEGPPTFCYTADFGSILLVARTLNGGGALAVLADGAAALGRLLHGIKAFDEATPVQSPPP